MCEDDPQKSEFVNLISIGPPPTPSFFFLKLAALVFGTCSHLEPIPVLVEARERPAISGSGFLDVVNSIMRHQDWDEYRAIAHRKPHAADALPRWIPNR